MFAVIVNPVSGGGEAARLAIRISERIAAMGQESRLFETSGDGDAARQTRAAVEAGCEAVVCIGGDGTLNEVVAGLCSGRGALPQGCDVLRRAGRHGQRLCPRVPSAQRPDGGV